MERTIATERSSCDDVRGERPVQLDLVDGQLEEVLQRAVAGAVVVDREPDPELVERLHDALRHLRVAHHRGLGDLDGQRRGRHAVLEQGAPRRARPAARPAGPRPRRSPTRAGPDARSRQRREVGEGDVEHPLGRWPGSAGSARRRRGTRRASSRPRVGWSQRTSASAPTSCPSTVQRSAGTPRSARRRSSAE